MRSVSAAPHVLSHFLLGMTSVEPGDDATHLRRMLLHAWASGLACPSSAELEDLPPEGPGGTTLPTAAMLQAAVRPSEWTCVVSSAGPTRLSLTSRELRFDVSHADGTVTVTWLVGSPKARQQSLHDALAAACQCASDTATKLAQVCKDPSEAGAMAALDAASQVLVGRAWETLHRRLWIAAMAWWLERGAPTVPALWGVLPAVGVALPIVDLMRVKAALLQHAGRCVSVAAAAAAAATAAEDPERDKVPAAVEEQRDVPSADVPSADALSAPRVLDPVREEPHGGQCSADNENDDDDDDEDSGRETKRQRGPKPPIVEPPKTVSAPVAAPVAKKGGGLRGLLANPAFVRTMKGGR